MNSNRGRKQKLIDRSYAYSVANTLNDVIARFWAANGFRDGYKAAMRDMRKVVNAATAEVPDDPSRPLFQHAVERARARHIHMSIAVRQFLKPLR